VISYEPEKTEELQIEDILYGTPMEAQEMIDRLELVSRAQLTLLCAISDTGPNRTEFEFRHPLGNVTITLDNKTYNDQTH